MTGITAVSSTFYVHNSTIYNYKNQLLLLRVSISLTLASLRCMKKSSLKIKKKNWSRLHFFRPGRWGTAVRTFKAYFINSKAHQVPSCIHFSNKTNRTSIYIMKVSFAKIFHKLKFRNLLLVMIEIINLTINYYYINITLIPFCFALFFVDQGNH